MSARNITPLAAKVTLIKANDCLKSLWKNGQGKTSQIAIYPPGATLANEDFLWRLSSAEVSANTKFSIFKSYDRLLTILSGKGIVINAQPLIPLNVIQFSGDQETTCQLLQDQVMDLGLIYKRDFISAKMGVKTFSASDDQHLLSLTDGVHLIVCVNGSFGVGSFVVNANDTLYIEGPFESVVTLQKPSTYVHIKICEIKNKPAFCKIATHG